MKRFLTLLLTCLLVANGYAQSPLIGISSSHGNGTSRVGEAYIQSVVKAGGVPVIVPVITDKETLNKIVEHLDALVMIGGVDIDPLIYGEQPHQGLEDVDPVRDEYEQHLIRYSLEHNLPILGICRGEQMINAFLGGTLYQDIPSQVKGYIKHRQTAPDKYGTHTITVEPGSKVAAITGKQQLTVNSFHHQSVKDVAPGFKVTALAPDGVIEAIESYPAKPILCVQWHPEEMTMGGDTTMLKFFRFIVEEGETFHKTKKKK